MTAAHAAIEMASVDMQCVWVGGCTHGPCVCPSVVMAGTEPQPVCGWLLSVSVVSWLSPTWLLCAAKVDRNWSNASVLPVLPADMFSSARSLSALRLTTACRSLPPGVTRPSRPHPKDSVGFSGMPVHTKLQRVRAPVMHCICTHSTSKQKLSNDLIIA